MVTYTRPERLVVLTGAGMSAESGIETFRGANGLWEGHRLEEVATPEAWRRQPDLVRRFYNERRRNLMHSLPNAGHEILAHWQAKISVKIITQNVDDLHERAGSKDVLHLHGELMKSRSCGPNETTRRMKGWEMTAHDRCPDGFQIRPHIVWFGEAVPNMSTAMELVKSADCLVVIGTSLQVYPAAQLAFETGADVPIHLIDPDANSLNQMGAEAWPMKASEGLKKLDNRWFGSDQC